ncbi:MAG: glycoside hydrolase family 2 protein [Ruminiclostridium sp.]
MKRINLNFDWQYKMDFKDEYVSVGVNNEGFELVNLPHTNKVLDYNNFDELEYQFISCYRKQVTIASEFSDKAVILKFEGIAAYARLYINGQYIAEHFGGYTPIEIDISGNVIYGQDNLLVIACDSTEREDIPPFGKVIDFLTYGGIYREAWIEIKEKTYIKDIFIRTFDVLSDAKTVDIDIELSEHCEDASILFQILNRNNDMESCFSFKLGNAIKGNIRGRVSKVELWDIETPNLYTLRAVLKQNDRILDKTSTKFGFREVYFKTDGFYINGRKTKLIGLNRHQSYPYVGYAMPESAQKKDADILKFELGVNIVRTSHYPQSKHFLNRCDEIGLLVFEEIPGWQHIGNDKWREIACQNVYDMIIRDRNHPSIIIWGVRINESTDCDELYIKTNNIAHMLDNTRATGGVRNFKESHLYEDVYTYNDFIHMGSNTALVQPSKVTKTNAPYLVTEHTGHMFPTKRFDDEDKRLEHALKHLRVLDNVIGSRRISGAIGWCMFDYNTHKDFGSGDRICYHGVSDMFRIPKLAGYVYASQQDSIPILEISAAMDIGEHPACELGTVYAFTNCDYMKLYKNDELIKIFYPDKKQFPKVKHAPIKIDDFIGDLLQKYENISVKDSDKFKGVLRAISKFGLNLPLSSKLIMGRLMLKYKLSLDDGVRLFGTYVSNWGAKRITFKFEGYKDGQLVKTVIKATATSAHLEVLPDSLQLNESETYDVTRIVIKALDENGNLLTYSNDAMNIETEGPVEIIGPKCVALIGGARAFWIKTIGQAGTGIVTIKSEKYGDNRIVFEVTKINNKTAAR